MPSTISAGTTAGTALNFTSDTTGNLAFQTNGTTTALSIDTNQNVTFANNVTYTGNIQGATITATAVFSGNGAGLTAINASNVSSGTLAAAQLPTTGVNASTITAGTVATARLASGTANSSTYLRGDQTWATISTSSGTVTSVATGNGLQGGTITTTGTLSVACPTFNTVGSYAIGGTGCPTEPGSNYSGVSYYRRASDCTTEVGGGLSGSWKFMGLSSGGDSGLYCRVS